ncbi:MAG: hypothetical protein HC886_01890 [Leptolyngbyaceae cyanobacterium SM1_1_3]|nr:hypothetical protein [Leptolyngbyaceae cyanobacterium SM1_1_3]
MISNGRSFLFLKLVQQPQPQYANSRLFSLLNPGNDFYPVLQIMKIWLRCCSSPITLDSPVRKWRDSQSNTR